MRFEWDADKDVSNQGKHGISFAEAAAMFRSGAPVHAEPDNRHEGDEFRVIAIGPIARGLICVVFVRHTADVIRLITARFATRREARMYDAWATGASS